MSTTWHKAISWVPGNERSEGPEYQGSGPPLRFGPGTRRSRNKGFNSRAVWLLATIACLACLGCKEHIDDDYGRRDGLGAEKSVNGTRVLSEMFEQAGHRVFSWNRLSPRLWQRADCIVWFPDDFEPPNEDVCFWLEAWLDDKPGRVLIYVGRDFDAAPWYWKKIEPQVPPERCKDFEEHRHGAVTRYALDRAEPRERQESFWFNLDPRGVKRSVRTLSGEPEWLEGIDPARLEVELRGRFEPMDGAVVLLESEGDVLISRAAVGQGKLFVVTNGSFLLNLPLVNHEHRKLAGKLIDVLPDEKQTVVFLESRSGGPPIQEKDPIMDMPSGAEIFTIWPTNWILIHLAVVGILFCFWRFPIFGFARPAEPERLSDFGKHLDAVAELLKQSGNEDYARQCVKEYIKKTKPVE